VSDAEPFDWEEKEGNELDIGVISTTAAQTTAEYVPLCFLLTCDSDAVWLVKVKI